ncbi:succinate dehydrogenase, cytochrome b556 subunit [Curtobacterium sp. MCLR17_007]|uniref:succinate dehydrogenase, cytochrome b556 subunit n=1 Tax=Curtobacterium sp. MCLR17_007 TaxID=2175648 RepID=UPI0021ABDF69|nr:succinate dehydrogenase, cytochrome b556 subunit [Curtobacterium sp. MCLR17_007]WIB59133.1 succinate dehydrogenase, cytochrome b556 subunit [Curtobacterium sp. MCLR17_007]
MAEQTTGGTATTAAPTVSIDGRPSGSAIESPRTPRTPQGTLYRGSVGMWSWVLHRITGVAIYFFLLVHILDTALVRLSPEAYNAVIGTYKTPIMNLGEIALVMAIVFHAFNGLRIILVDFWSKGPKYQRAMFWVVLVLWAVAIAGFLPRQLMNLVADFH